MSATTRHDDSQRTQFDSLIDYRAPDSPMQEERFEGQPFRGFRTPGGTLLVLFDHLDPADEVRDGE